MSDLIADAELAVEDLLLSLPAFKYLGVSTKLLLEARRDVLDGVDYSTMESTSLDGSPVSRLKIARLNNLPNAYADLVQQTLYNCRPRVSYYQVPIEKDPFQGSSSMYTANSVEADDAEKETDHMFNTGISNGFPHDLLTELQIIVAKYENIFRI